ncbi:SDR family oxidoreductase [Rhodococcus oryzae]|uniref:SDR family oxidoreductase n=1 Tax=Rhodococcus oryzae TaxID=2571143 RepID=A0ABY2RPH5_9NOCA|nr:SDR family oxidoreductase [Rhodococcus oryzae]TJZ79281.1 SDR family oxidoreductase [Rhodococcus oryzae]
MAKQTVVITGAAAGIGRATALEFARAGYLVGAFDIDETGLAALAREIRAGGGEVSTGLLDVTDPEQWDARLAEFAEVASHRLDILVNNAGVLSSGRFEEMSPAEHRRMVDINVGGVVLGSRAAFPYLQATPGSQLVNLCSASAIYGQPELATYSATKFAIRGLTEALELEWRRHRIRVLAVWPLFVNTAMTGNLDMRTADSLGIKLTAIDVAKVVVKATRRSHRMLAKVHYPVGRQAGAMMMASRFSPAWLTREINRRISHS